MILCIGATPAIQRVMVFRKLALDAVNRAVMTFDGIAGKSVNVAKVLKTLGEQPTAVGFLGGDRGEYLRKQLQSRSIEMDFVTVQPGTRQCVTVLDEANKTVTELVEESQPVAGEDYDALFAIVQKHVPACSAVIMSGTLTPGAPADFYFHCAQKAHAAGTLAVIDAQGISLHEALPATPDVVKPNRSELAATVGRELADEQSVMSAMRELNERGAKRVIVTAGTTPTLAFDGRSFWRARVPQVSMVNPIGSGDAFTAGLVWRLLRGEDLGEACRWASATGAANTLTMLAGEVNYGDVDRIVKQVVVEELIN